ncbi:glutaredoxin [Candidatus Peregrinibacteria bacterium]|nr:MAG: glutaredoxin [Candidatus Peregrinibacteria bacterium]
MSFFSKVFSVFFFFTALFSVSAAQEDTVYLEYFGRADCQHCVDQRAFLDILELERPNMEVVYYDIDTDEGKALFLEVTEKAGLSKITPITFAGNRFVSGFGSEKTTGKRFRELLDYSEKNKTVRIDEYLTMDNATFESELVEGGTCDATDVCEVPSSAEWDMELPIINKVVNIQEMSLLTVSILLGFADGFNPCAMWVLIMFLTILMQTGDRKKMFQVAGTFILAEGIMYYAILNVWMTTWDFVGMDRFVTPVIGLTAMAAGVFFLWEYKTADGTCKVTSLESQQKTRSKIAEIVSSKFTIVTFFAILGIAFSVNIIEFACSLGFPQAFTKMLELNQISWFEREWYMFIYILFYMIDDVIVFLFAIYSFEYLSSMHLYTKYAQLIGGVMMLILGGIMIFNPNILVF